MLKVLQEARDQLGVEVRMSSFHGGVPVACWAKLSSSRKVSR